MEESLEIEEYKEDAGEGLIYRSWDPIWRH